MHLQMQMHLGGRMVGERINESQYRPDKELSSKAFHV